MKWIPLDKSKKLEFNAPLFLKEEHLGVSAFHFGKLVEIKQTDKGLQHTFEVATFANEKSEPVYLTSIKFVAVPK